MPSLDRSVHLHSVRLASKKQESRGVDGEERGCRKESFAHPCRGTAIPLCGTRQAPLLLCQAGPCLTRKQAREEARQRPFPHSVSRSKCFVDPNALLRVRQSPPNVNLLATGGNMGK